MKRYMVIGSQPVLGNKMPGDTFDADLEEGQEQFLLGISAIKIVSNDVKADGRIGPKKPAARTKRATPKNKKKA